MGSKKSTQAPKFDPVWKDRPTSPPLPRVDEGAVRLFENQAVTITKTQSVVKVICDDADDANTIFYWLANIVRKDKGFDNG